MRAIPILVVALLVAASPAHAADEWSASFPPEILASSLPAVERARIVVVAADDVNAPAAALALRNALAATGRALAIDQSAMGSVAGLDDRAIVEKAAPLPIELIAVVRVFSDAGGAAPTAV